jgi:SAM-dependent methyltransferase
MEATHYEQADLWGEHNVFTPEHHQARFDAIARLVPVATRTVVDVGAGDGRVANHLASRRPDLRIVAMERSRQALRHVDFPAAQASIDALPLAPRSFDAALCCEVLEHLPIDVFDAARSELEAVADSSIIITVPNREHRNRAEVRCHECGCRYNPDRHLRSFTPDELTRLFNGFDLDEVIETGPRQPVYPRWARVALERVGVLTRPGSPSCPQCGAVYRFAGGPATKPLSPDDSRSTPGGDLARRGYRAARRAAPKARHPYFLCARFRRRA